jgi:hypothetical protein
MRKHIRFVSITGASLCLGLSVLLPASGANAGAKRSNATITPPACVGMPANPTANVVAISAIANGQTATTVQSGCYTYKYVGATGSSYAFSQGAATLSVPNSKVTPGATLGLSSNTVYDNAVAVGFTPEEATQIANQASAVGNSLAMTSSARASRIKSMATGNGPAKGTIIGSPCVSVSGNGGAATGRTCDVQVIMQSTGQDWYIGDQLTSSGHDDTTWNNLTQLTGNDNYVGGNSIVEWNPSGFQSTGNCTSYNESIGYNGVGIGSTQTVCPSGIGPQWPNPTTGQGVTWTGCSSNTQGAPGVDLLHSPAGVSDSMVVRITVGWAWC